MYPNPPVSMVATAKRVEDFPYITEEYLVLRQRERRTVGDADDSAAAAEPRSVQRHGDRRGDARRRPVADFRVVARVDSDGVITSSRRSCTARRNIQQLKTFNAERYAPMNIARGLANEIIAQFGRLMKSGAGPLAAYSVRRADADGRIGLGRKRPQLPRRPRGSADARRRTDLRRLSAHLPARRDAEKVLLQDSADYQNRVNKRLDELIRDGWFLPPYRGRGAPRRESG